MVTMWCLSQNNEFHLSTIRKAGIPDSVINILANRGYDSDSAILDFVRPSLFDFHSPYLFKDMTLIIDRLKTALELQEKVLVYGDYDVDGVTGTALLYKVMKNFGFNVIVHIPSREEGYGLHPEVVEKAAANRVSLIVTVDCGITAVEEISLAKNRDIDVIITDHHEPPEQLPPALAILNPKVAGSGYPFPHLAGVGVAYKLVQALFSSLKYPAETNLTELEYLDLVALGTIADIVPLSGENRIIAKYGLKVMENTKHTGLNAILEECGLKGKKLKAGQISFIIAPRINAAGRMDTARLALNLLLEENYQDALEVAGELSKENSQRQLTEQHILEEAEAMLAGKAIPEVIVLSSPDWHHGVIGIVASRLVERFHRPVYLVCEEGEIGKGSARGIPNYHVFEELEKQAGLLEKFGGHKQAAGFTIKVANLEQFRNGLIRSFLTSGFSYQEQILIDAVVPCSEIGLGLQKELEQMGPFGAGNPAPVLMTAGLAIKRIFTMGKKGEHLKMMLLQDHNHLETVAFKKGKDLEELKNIPAIDIIYSLEANEYLGEVKIQAVLRDYRPASNDSLQEIACAEEQPARYEKVDADDWLNQTGRLDRQMLVEEFKYLKSLAGPENILFLPSNPQEEKRRQVLKIFEELGLLTWLGGAGSFLIKLNGDQKTDLQNSLRYRMLS